MSSPRRLRPLTIPQLRLAAERGELTPEDIQACSWIRRARTPRFPHTRVGEIVEEIAVYLRAWREDKHINAKEFGESVGLAGSFISQIECGFKERVTLDTLLRIADGVGAELKIEFRPRKGKRNVKAA